MNRNQAIVLAAVAAILVIGAVYMFLQEPEAPDIAYEDGEWEYTLHADGTASVDDSLVNHFFQDLTVPSSVEHEGRTYTVTSVSMNNSYPSVVRIPATVETIDVSSLRHPQLQAVHVDDGNQSYTSVDGVLYDGDLTTLLLVPRSTELTYLDLPGTVTALADNAIDSQIGLELHEGIVSLGDSCLGGLKAGTFSIPSTLTEFDDKAFADVTVSCFTVAEGNTALMSVDGILFTADGGSIVAYLRELRASEYTVPDSVDRVYPYAFYRSDVGSFVLHDGLDIGEYAFSGSSATSYAIGTGTTIGNNAFSRTNAASIAIPEGCLIGEEAFYRASVRELTVGDGCTIGNRAFLGCSDLVTAVVGTSISEIPEYAFAGCRSLTDIALSDGLTGIGYYAFYGCTGLKSVDLPSSLQSLGMYSFSNSGLVSVSVPQGTVISAYAFHYCRSLASAEIDTGSAVGEQAFTGTALTAIAVGPSAAPNAASESVPTVIVEGYSGPASASVSDGVLTLTLKGEVSSAVSGESFASIVYDIDTGMSEVRLAVGPDVTTISMMVSMY